MDKKEIDELIEWSEDLLKQGKFGEYTYIEAVLQALRVSQDGDGWVTESEFNYGMDYKTTSLDIECCILKKQAEHRNVRVLIQYEDQLGQADKMVETEDAPEVEKVYKDVSELEDEIYRRFGSLSGHDLEPEIAITIDEYTWLKEELVKSLKRKPKQFDVLEHLRNGGKCVDQDGFVYWREPLEREGYDK